MNIRLAASAIMVFASSGLQLKAQYIGDQFVGLTGLKAGSQPGPGYYITVPLYFLNDNISIYGAQGNQILKNATGNIDLYMLPAVQVVTPYKILGATYVLRSLSGSLTGL